MLAKLSKIRVSKCLAKWVQVVSYWGVFLHTRAINGSDSVVISGENTHKIFKQKLKPVYLPSRQDLLEENHQVQNSSQSFAWFLFLKKMIKIRT